MSGPITTPYKSVLHGVHTRLGGTPADLQTEVAAAITEHVNAAYKHGWRYYEWPDAVEVEERTTDADGLIDWQQAGELVIETPFLLTKRDPRVSENPGVVGFRSHKQGIYCPYDSTALWLTFRPRCPVFTSEEYSATATYSDGDRVYWPTTGECYLCIDDTTAGDAPSDATHWEVIPFLDLLAEPVKAGAHAAMLREEGQHSPSLAMEQAMADLLLRELERIELQSGQYRLIRTSTY